jgi:hypothetical protein
MATPSSAGYASHPVVAIKALISALIGLIGLPA